MMSSDNYPLKKIEEFTNVITGGTPSTVNEKYWKNGIIPWLASGDLNDVKLYKSNKFITKLGLKNSSARLMPKKTILIALTGTTTGKTAILEFESSANQSVTGILPSEEHIPEYLFYYLRKIRPVVLKLSYGGAQPHISQKFVKEIKIPLPPLQIQNKIATILETCEVVIAKRKETIRLADEFLKSTFIEMFGDPYFNPKGWDCFNLDNLVKEFRYGSSNKSSEKGFPILRIPNVVNNKIDLFDLKYCKVSNAEFKKLKLQKGDILFVRSNGNQDYTGRSAVCSYEHEGFVFASYLIRARVIKSKLNSIYLHHYLNSSYGKMQLKSKTKTSAGQYNINTKGLGSLRILLPPIENQNKFVKIVNKIKKLQQKQKESLAELENLFNSLMQKAFRGGFKK